MAHSPQNSQTTIKHYLLALHLSAVVYRNRWYNRFQDIFQKNPNSPEELIKQLNTFFCILEPDEYQNYLKQARSLIENNIPCFTLNDKIYPELLKEIPFAPLVLFYKGNLSILQDEHNHFFSIVGTRKPSEIARAWLKAVAGYLSENNLILVSGMADGIDSVVHQAALSSGNKTIGILANGPDYIYPQKNHELYRQATEGTQMLLLSEYPQTHPPKRYHFVRRNRIISGLSQHVLFTEGSLKSGGLITVRYALEQGREVYAFDNERLQSNAGGRKLIEDGAPDLGDYFPITFMTDDHKDLLKKIENNNYGYIGSGRWMYTSTDEHTASEFLETVKAVPVAQA